VAFTASEKATDLLSAVHLKQNLVLKIDGIPDVFGARSVFISARIGDPGLFIGTFRIGGGVEDPNSRPWITLDGTTNNISQQIEEKGSATSITNFTTSIIDKGEYLTKIFAPGEIVPDILGRKADVYVALEDSSYLEDGVRIISGLIESIEYGPTTVSVTIAHNDAFKKSEIFQEYKSALTSGIDSSVTTIPAASITGFILAQDALTSYIRIDDEIIKVGGISVLNFTGCTRAQFGTVAVSHSIDAEIESVYTLSGDPIELALKVMLSNGGTSTLSESVTSFNIFGTNTVPNSIFFKEIDAEIKLNLIVGDLVTTTGAANGANNVSNKAILGFTKTTKGTYVTIAGVSFVNEIDSAATVSIISKYNVLPEDASLGMEIDQVDVQRHLRIKSLLGTLPTLTVPITEAISGKELIEEEFYFPVNIYAIPRNARSSLNAVLPPLATEGFRILDKDNVRNPETLKLKRRVNGNFYNALVFKFGYNIPFDKFKAGQIFYSANSQDKIKVGNRVYTVESKGLQNDAPTTTFIQNSAARLFARYQFGAEELGLSCFYKAGVTLDIGDTVVLDDTDMKMSDTKKGVKGFGARVFEVQNKELNLKTGDVTLNLVDTIYSATFRYGVFGPASKLGAGSTTTQIKIKQSYETTVGQNETYKWENYSRQLIRVRSEDLTFNETRELLGIFNNSADTLSLLTPLSTPPLENYVIEMATYDSGTKTLEKFRIAHGFSGARVSVVTGISGTSFTVAGGDIAKFFVGSLIRVHNTAYTIDSGSEPREVTSIVSNTINLNKTLGFTPAVGQEIDLIGFAFDEGNPYVYF